MNVHVYTPLIDHEGYEILIDHPYTIRNIKTKHELKEHMRSNYPAVNIQNKHYYKHLLIVKQFLPNPDGLTSIKHINRDKSDYHLNNLKWSTQSEASLNRSKGKKGNNEFVESIPEDAMEVKEYLKNNFDNYYYSPSSDTFYYFTGNDYRKLNINTDKNNLQYVFMQSNDKKSIQVYNIMFKLYHKLISKEEYKRIINSINQ